MDTDLQSILADEPTEAAPAVEEQPPASAERPRDEHGRFTTVEPGDPPAAEAPPVEAAPPAAPQDAEPGHIPVKALQDERQKRQQLEQQLQQYEAYFQQLQQPQSQPQAQGADPEADPLAWIVEQVIGQVMPQVQQYGNTFDVQMNAKVSERLARQRYPDYDTVIEASFKDAIAANPMLQAQLARQDDPAEYAYKVGKQWDDAKKFGSAAPVSRDDLKAELRAELMSELGLSSTPKAPSSLASERSVGSRSGPAWSGPASLDEILR